MRETNEKFNSNASAMLTLLARFSNTLGPPGRPQDPGFTAKPVREERLAARKLYSLRSSDVRALCSSIPRCIFLGNAVPKFLVP